MNLSLMALAIAAFGIGTTEFVIMGLLPNVASDLSVTIPQAGLLVTGYALSVTIGAPIMALATARLSRKKALVGLMGIFILGNILCATAANYELLMFARVITALCHGAFFGIGSVEAASLVAPNKRAQAVAMMFTGLTLANVLGVPLGTALGQEYGWRSTFAVVAVIGVIALAALSYFLPKDHTAEAVDMKREFRALGHKGLWVALSMTVMFSASMFALFTYIAPILLDVTHVSANAVTGTLLLIGLGLTVGNILGGKLADWKLRPSLIGIAIAAAIIEAAFAITSGNFIAAEITLFLWGMITFASVPGLQVNVVQFGREAPNLVATLNIGAFNLGNALGAWAGGFAIERGVAYSEVPLVAAGMAVIAVVISLYALKLGRALPTQSDTQTPANDDAPAIAVHAA